MPEHDEAYEPTEQDIAEYHAWRDSLESRDRDDWIAWNDRLAAIHEGSEVASGGLTDADLVISTGCAG